jgi:hypothetical protein
MIEKIQIPNWLIALVSTALICSTALISLYAYKFFGPLSSDQGVWGQFGDYAGGILNPIFSVTALFALLYTIVLQTKELRESSAQLEKSATALSTQNSVLLKQSFETSFFNLMNQLNELVRDLVAPNGLSKGKKCFEWLNDSFVTLYVPDITHGDFTTEPDRELINKRYTEFYKQNSDLMGHYFRTLYNILKFIDRGYIEPPEKKFYTNIIRAQLSKYELSLILYNCASSYGREKLLPLIIKYDILKHLEPESLAAPDHQKLVVASN